MNELKDMTVRNFDSLLQQALKNPLSFDYKELRLKYSESPNYRPYLDDVSVFSKVEKALESKDFDVAEKLLSQLLSECFVSIRGHLLAEELYLLKQDSSLAQSHAHFGWSLIRSIIENARIGVDDELIFEVVSVSEEYEVLSALNLKPLSQTICKSDDLQYFDVFKVRHKYSKQEQQVRFIINRPFAWLKQQESVLDFFPSDQNSFPFSSSLSSGSGSGLTIDATSPLQSIFKDLHEEREREGKMTRPSSAS
eukprot:GCRY01002093.1.p1 GENE.GCRY01002093.1~~GCRY01002093.1.p1  ORF type:complete len:252 (-),score=33.25 GCRY01002093.1:728-1483(-)